MFNKTKTEDFILKLEKLFIEEIKGFETIYCLISGGYHSTTSALLLHDYGFRNIVLVHNKTFLEMKSSIRTMQKIQNITKYPYIEIIPDLKGDSVWDIMRKSLQKIPEVREDIKNKKYDRSKFECCRKLKKSPGYKFFRTKENSIVIDSQCPYESNQRNYRLREIRNDNTYLREMKKGYVKAYPFRDFYSEKPFLPYLRRKGFSKIKHSGCIICPILIVFKMYKEERYYNTLKAMARAGLPCFEKTMENFI